MKESKHTKLTYRLYGEKEVNMYWIDEYDIVTYCDINECSDCPRYGDDCDGKEEDDESDR